MINFNTRFLLLAAVSVFTYGTAVCQEIAFQSKYLSTAVAAFHGYHISGKTVGPARLTLNPNSCGLDLYGDRTICTLIAPTTADVTLTELEILDPTGQGRHIFAVNNHGLAGDLKLVTTASANDGWFVFTERNGQRTVIDLDPTALPTKVRPCTPSGSCVPLPYAVDGTKAQYKIVPGFVSDTWILLLKGKKQNGGTRIEFQPVTYVQRPDYWEIDVAECSDGIAIPVITPYDEAFEITPYLGKKGIELTFGDQKVRIDVLPTEPE